MEEMVMMRQLKVSELIAVDGGRTVSFYDGYCGTIPHYPLPLGDRRVETSPALSYPARPDDARPLVD
jgi:hypothetical protein